MEMRSLQLSAKRLKVAQHLQNISLFQTEGKNPSFPRFFEVITVSEMRNITIDGNVTELQGVVTYDITELRMDPNYIRCQCQDTLLVSQNMETLVPSPNVNGHVGLSRSGTV